MFLTRTTHQFVYWYSRSYLATLPEYLSSPLVFSGVYVAQSIVLRVVLCWPLLVLFLLAIALSVPLSFTTFNSSWVSFKLFCRPNLYTIIYQMTNIYDIIYSPSASFHRYIDLVSVINITIVLLSLYFCIKLYYRCFL